MGFVDDIDKKWGDSEIFDVVNSVMDIVLINAKFKYAPRGATNSLRDGILISRAYRQGKFILALITSESKQKDVDYAEIQHDEELRHASPPSMGDDTYDTSFADHGDHGTTFKRYWQGYHKLINLGLYYKYTTKYLDKALGSVEDMLDRELAAL